MIGLTVHLQTDVSHLQKNIELCLKKETLLINTKSMYKSICKLFRNVPAAKTHQWLHDL